MCRSLTKSNLSSGKASRKRQGGFTLAELLAAMLFMALVIPVTLNGIAIANRVFTVAERKMIATHLAEQKMYEMLLTETWRNTQGQGAFTDERQAYTWNLISESWAEDSMRHLTLIVTFTVQDKDYFVQVSTLADESEE